MEGLSMAQGLGLAYALASGMLIGLERGWKARALADGSRVAGFRTFSLFGLTGGIAALLPGWSGTALILGAALVVAIGYWRATLLESQLSATDATTALITLGLGVMAARDQAPLAIAAAAVVTLLLSMRDATHRWLRGMSEVELRAFTRFALIAFVIWPLAPDMAMGPLDAWNPHKLWLVVVLVCGLAFLGYVTGRRAEPSRNVLLTAVCGAIVSSTAVTAACARRMTRADRGSALSIAILLATAVMILRMLILTALIVPSAAASLLLIAAPGWFLLGVPILLGLRQAPDASDAKPFVIANPLELRMALGLAGLTAVLMLAARWAQAQLGHLGVAGLITITGLVDVDAAIMTLGATDLATIPPRTAGLVLAGSMIANNLLKAGLTASLAPHPQGRRTAAWLGASSLASGATLGMLMVG